MVQIATMATHRLGYIDSMRGLAALAVIYFHTAYQLLRADNIALGAIEQSLFRFLSQDIELGKVAVVLFFAVSGFVVPFSLDKRRQHPIAEFVVSRFFRLYPAYWLSVGLMAAFLIGVLGMTISPGLIAVNLTMLQRFVGVENLNDIYWTLQIELIFYVLCGLLFYVDKLFRPKWVFGCALLMLLGALLMAWLRFQLGKSLPVALPLSLAVMFWGLLWRLKSLEHNLLASRLWSLLSGLILLLLLPICMLAYSQDQGFGESWQRYLATYYLALALFVLLSSRIRLQHPVLTYLGAISYSLYLLGPIGQGMAQALLAPYYPQLTGHLVIGLAILISLAMASLAYHLVERPTMRWGQQLKQHWLRNQTPAKPAAEVSHSG